MILWMEEILHQLVVYPIIYRMSTICLVAQDFATIHSMSMIFCHDLPLSGFPCQVLCQRFVLTWMPRQKWPVGNIGE